jgi:hypothetical protein
VTPRGVGTAAKNKVDQFVRSTSGGISCSGAACSALLGERASNPRSMKGSANRKTNFATCGNRPLRTYGVHASSHRIVIVHDDK